TGGKRQQNLPEMEKGQGVDTLPLAFLRACRLRSLLDGRRDLLQALLLDHSEQGFQGTARRLGRLRSAVSALTAEAPYNGKGRAGERCEGLCRTFRHARP